MKLLYLKDGNSVIIREAEGTDASKILDYVNLISSQSDFLTFGPGEFMMTVEQEEKFLEDTLKRNNALYIIAELNGEIVGSLNFSAGTRPRKAHIGEFGVSVLKDYWGNGIAAELIKYLIKWSVESKIIRKINLLVRNDNFAAIHLYKKLGFTEEGLITRDFQINNKFYDSLLMGYTIN